jgi:hypothetical protein
MRHFLLVPAAAALIAGGMIAGSAPAKAQVYFDAGPGGVGVGVGDPDYRWRHRHWRDRYDAYATDCRVIRERVETPSGRVIYRTRRICD